MPNPFQRRLEGQEVRPKLAEGREAKSVKVEDVGQVKMVRAVVNP